MAKAKPTASFSLDSEETVSTRSAISGNITAALIIGLELNSTTGKIIVRFQYQ